MAATDVKFSNFADGGDLEVDDTIVGLRNGVNTRFNFNGSPGLYLPLVGGTMEGPIDMDGNSITGVPTPTLPSDAVPLSSLTAIGTPSPLTIVNDTNVTLTLGGTPATALLQSVSITAGWAGQLGLTRGGTNASLTASNGGIVYSTTTAMAILSGTATAGQILMSGSSAAPIWSTATYPATAGTTGNVLKSNGVNWVSAADTPGALTNNHIYVGDVSNVAQDVAMSGDATIVASGALTIANNAVSNAKLAQMPTLTIKGNNTGGSANALDLTVAQVNTMLGTSSGRLLAVQVIKSSGTVTANAGANKWLIYLKGGGGGGAGGTVTPVPGQGGSEAGICVAYITVTPSTGYTYTQAAGGNGGTATNNGSTGGNSTLLIGATTYQGSGGEGGHAAGYGSAGGGVVNESYGIGGTTASTVASSLTSGSGAGAGANGAPGTVAAGTASSGNSGAGGSGGYGNNSGGAGGSGYLIVYEYS